MTTSRLKLLRLLATAAKIFQSREIGKTAWAVTPREKFYGADWLADSQSVGSKYRSLNVMILWMTTDNLQVEQKLLQKIVAFEELLSTP